MTACADFERLFWLLKLRPAPRKRQHHKFFIIKNVTFHHLQVFLLCPAMAAMARFLPQGFEPVTFSYRSPVDSHKRGGAGVPNLISKQKMKTKRNEANCTFFVPIWIFFFHWTVKFDLFRSTPTFLDAKNLSRFNHPVSGSQPRVETCGRLFTGDLNQIWH